MASPLENIYTFNATKFFFVHMICQDQIWRSETLLNMAELKIPSLGIRSILGPNYSDLEYQSCINTPVLIQIILE